jgi:hypothetical protein
MIATITSFPLSKHTGGGDATPAFSGQWVYSQLTWEVGLPTFPVEFSSHYYFFKISPSWLLGVCCRSCLLESACLFTVHMGSGPSPFSCGVFLSPPLFQAFPLLVAGQVLPLLPSPASLFIYSSCGKWVFPPLLWSFPPTDTFTSFPAPSCWACATAPAFSGQLVYLQFHEGLPLPPSLALRAPCPLCYMSFLLLLLLFV